MTRLPWEHVWKQVNTEEAPPLRIIRLIKLSYFISVRIANYFSRSIIFFLWNSASCFVSYISFQSYIQNPKYSKSHLKRVFCHTWDYMMKMKSSKSCISAKESLKIMFLRVRWGGGKRGLRKVCIKSASFSFCLNLLMNEKVLCHTKYLSFLLASRVLELEKVKIWVFW